MENLSVASDILCVFGINGALYEELLPWLQGGDQRRLIFVEDRPEISFQFSDPRALIYTVETPLQLVPIAEKIGWSAVFLTLEIRNESDSPYFPLFQKTLQDAHASAHALLSDAADFGVTAARHT